MILSLPDFLWPMKHLDFGGFLQNSPLRSIFVCCTYESTEQRMRLERLRLELWMELAPDEVGMIGQFHHLHVSAVWSRTGEAKSSRGQWFFVLAIELVTMPVALADFQRAVNFVRQRTGFDPAGPRT